MQGFYLTAEKVDKVICIPLDPRAREYLERYYKNPQQLTSATYQKEKIYKTEDKIIKTEDGYDLPIRIYYPSETKNLPILVYFHSGGFVSGSIESEDNLTRILANSCNCITVSVEYRLAPKYKFPTAVYDCFEATKWAYENAEKIGGNKSKIAVAGHSAGGNLAAVVALLARDNGLKLSAQALIVPVIYADFASNSMIEYRKGYFLDMPSIKNSFIWQYVRDERDLFNPLFAPILAEDLSNLPPAIIVTAEYDPLRDQGEAYAARLMEAGVDTISIRVNGSLHSFVGIPNLIKRVFIMVGYALRDILSA